MPKVNDRDIFEIKEWLNDTPQNVEEYEKMVGGTAPSGTIEISANGEYDVSEYATADVQVEGGGSSDFSTAEVTFNAGDGIVLEDVITLQGLVGERYLVYDEELRISGTQIFRFLLIDGYYDCSARSVSPETKTISVVGDGSYDEDSQILAIEGDCEVTVTDN